MSDPRAGGGSRTHPGTAADVAEAEGRQRPPRPAWVELAAAMLVVSGATSLIQTVSAFASLADRTTPSEPLFLLSIAIGIGTVVLGILVRYGRAWLVAVNVAAIAGFLELTSGTPQGLVLGALDVIVVAILVSQRPWFAWTPEADRDDRDDRD